MSRVTPILSSRGSSGRSRTHKLVVHFRSQRASLRGHVFTRWWRSEDAVSTWRSLACPSGGQGDLQTRCCPAGRRWGGVAPRSRRQPCRPRPDCWALLAGVTPPVLNQAPAQLRGRGARARPGPSRLGIVVPGKNVDLLPEKKFFANLSGC